jgi:hypothetical protein
LQQGKQSVATGAATVDIFGINIKHSVATGLAELS